MTQSPNCNSAYAPISDIGVLLLLCVCVCVCGAYVPARRGLRLCSVCVNAFMSVMHVLMCVYLSNMYTVHVCACVSMYELCFNPSNSHRKSSVVESQEILKLQV